MLITAAVYGLAACVTFVWLRERATPVPASANIPRSFAPSPTAKTCAGVTPNRAEISIIASTLASLPKMGSATCPVNLPSATNSVLARFSSNPKTAAICVVKAVNPPDTKAQ
mgnify:CR=1 FL=1